jgi:predicted transcriptional regulator of viral defense system
MILNKNVILKQKLASDQYAYNLLYKLHKKNELKKITKGNYTKTNDIFYISTNLFSPAYLSFWSASYFKGYSEQIVNELQVVVTKRHKKIEFENYSLLFINFSKKLFFGFEKIKFGSNFIFVVDDEKLLIDSLLREDLMGNFDEIIKVVKKTSIVQEKIINYLKKINNKSLNKRIGFLLEKYKQIDISKKIDFKDKNYVNLSNFLDCKKINKKWMVKY